MCGCLCHVKVVKIFFNLFVKNRGGRVIGIACMEYSSLGNTFILGSFACPNQDMSILFFSLFLIVLSNVALQ